MQLLSILSKLNTDSSSPPVAAVNELIQWISTGKLSENELGSCWHLTSQLLKKYSNHAQVLKPLILEFMGACMTYHSIRMGPILWKEFLKFASSDWEGNQDLESRIKVLVQLTKDGRDVTGIEDEIGSVLVSWLQEIVLNGSKSNSLLLLGFITNIFKFSRLYLDAENVFQLLALNRKFLELTKDNQLITSALQLYDAVTRYGGMPEPCLEIITEGLINLDSDEELIHSILKNILASHLSTALVRILVEYLDEDSVQECNKIQKVLKLLSVWKWQENLETLNLSDYLLISLFPKFLQIETYLKLILECVALFLNSKDPFIVEWSLVAQISYEAIPQVISDSETICSFSKTMSLDRNHSSENVTQFIVCKLMVNFEKLLPQDKKSFQKLLLQILPNIDDPSCLFLIDHEDDLKVLVNMVALVLNRNDKQIVFTILEKIDRWSTIDASLINMLVNILHLVEDAAVLSNLLHICLRIPCTELLDQLSKIIAIPKNDQIVLCATKGITQVWDVCVYSSNPENIDVAVKTFRRILSHFTDEKLSDNIRIFLGKFLCDFRAIRKRIQYVDMEKGCRRICHYLVIDNGIQHSQVTVLPISEYFSKLTRFLNREPNWQVYCAILKTVEPQLTDSIVYESPDGKQFLNDFLQSIVSMIQTDTVGAQLIDVPSKGKVSELFPVFLRILSTLMQSPRKFISKKLLYDAVLCFLSGLSRPTLSRFCMHSLTVAMYEYPFSIMKYLSSIILRLSKMTSISQGIENLEFLAHLGKTQSLHVNLTKDDYKRVFGICLQYLRVETRDNVQSRYIVHLAHKILSLWFVSLQISERRIYLPFIIKQLMISGLSEDAELVLDKLAIYSFSDCEARTQIRNTSIAGKTWLWGNTLITVNTHPNSIEWNEIIIRRPSGALSMWSRLENSFISADQHPYIPAPVSYWIKKGNFNKSDYQKRSHHTRSQSTGSVHFAGLSERISRARRLSTGNSGSLLLMQNRRSVSVSSPSSLIDDYRSTESESTDKMLDTKHSQSRDKRIDPSFMLAQMSGIPNTFMNDNSNLPILLPAEESINRALSVLDKTPVLDLHKIGVLFMDKGQKSEAEMLRNTCGSKAYGEFLESLGTWFHLKETGSLYSGGLDTSPEALDGPFALTYADRLSQCVFHVTTVMPSSKNDPMSTFKKRHIGNNFVNIIWNESGNEYSIDTLEGQFNFVAIVIECVNTEYQVKVLSRMGMPNHFLFCEPRLVSQKCLGRIIRTLAIHCDIYSQMWINRFVSSPRERLAQIYRLRDRLSISKTNDILGMYDFSLYL